MAVIRLREKTREYVEIDGKIRIYIADISGKSAAIKVFAPKHMVIRSSRHIEKEQLAQDPPIKRVEERHDDTTD